MTTKLVCRLLDLEGALLGWVAVNAVARGDGLLWSPGPVTIAVQSPGRAVVLSVHWCDVNVETRIPVPARAVYAGEVLVVFAAASPMVKVGEMPGPLPAVTVGSVAVGVPVGQFGAVGLQ